MYLVWKLINVWIKIYLACTLFSVFFSACLLSFSSLMMTKNWSSMFVSSLLWSPLSLHSSLKIKPNLVFNLTVITPSTTWHRLHPLLLHLTAIRQHFDLCFSSFSQPVPTSTSTFSLFCTWSRVPIQEICTNCSCTSISLQAFNILISINPSSVQITFQSSL